MRWYKCGNLLYSYTGTDIGIGFYGSGKADNFYIDGAPVPEPATLLLFGLGILGIAGVSRKKTA